MDGEVEHCQVYGVSGQVQDGVDIVVRRANDYRVIQCKRRRTEIRVGHLTSAVDEFVTGSWRHRAAEFVLAVSSSVEPTHLANQIEAQQRRLASLGIRFTVWDETSLSTMLKAQRQIVEDFFGVGVAVEFFGPVDSSTAAHTTASSVQYFLAGCGVGNSLALLPLGDGDSAERSLRELIAALGEIGVEEGDFAPLTTALALAQRPEEPTSSELKKVISNFFDSMNRLPGIVRSQGHEDDYIWFRLGELLYRAATVSIVESPGDGGSAVHLRALAALAERPEFPRALRGEIGSFVSKSEREPDALYESANEIAGGVYSLLR